ncbi:MAG: hypothetical protein ACR2NQ_04180 [Thermodesulfobacteriota bacterium]
MHKSKIRITIEGPDKNDRHLELSVFSGKVRHFLDFLNASVKESGESAAKFCVVNLSHSSPVAIECEPVGKDSSVFSTQINAVKKVLDSVKTEETVTLSNTSLSAIERFAEFHPDSISKIDLEIINGKDEKSSSYKIDSTFRESLRKARSSEESVFTTFDGRLEEINIHGNPTCRIYPDLPEASYVSCKFPAELLEKVSSSLGLLVSVSGECFYRPGKNFPYKVNVSKINALPDPNDLPSLGDLYGIAPDATGNETPEQFVREMRDKWGDKS